MVHHSQNNKMQKRKAYKIETFSKQATVKKNNKHNTVPMTEEETAALFLSDINKICNSNTINSSKSNEGDTMTSTPNITIASDSANTITETTKVLSSNKKNKKNKTITTVVPKSKPKMKPTINTNKKTQLNSSLLSLPLEEGEEDPTVSAEVLKQTATFLARLSPARSKQFWALRQVARGEKHGRTVEKSSQINSNESESETESDYEEEEEEEEEEYSDNNSNNDSHENKDDVSMESTEEEKEERNIKTGTTKNGKNNFKSKGDRGGALFNSNPDVWDD